MVGKWESFRPLYPYLQKQLFLDEVFFDRENVVIYVCKETWLWGRIPWRMKTSLHNSSFRRDSPLKTSTWQFLMLIVFQSCDSQSSGSVVSPIRISTIPAGAGFLPSIWVGTSTQARRCNYNVNSCEKMYLPPFLVDLILIQHTFDIWEKPRAMFFFSYRYEISRKWLQASFRPVFDLFFSRNDTTLPQQGNNNGKNRIEMQCMIQLRRCQIQAPWRLPPSKKRLSSWKSGSSDSRNNQSPVWCHFTVCVFF